MKRASLLILSVAGIAVATTVSAANYQVDSVAGLVAQLKASEGKADVIQLAPGDYWLRDEDIWHVDSTIGTNMLYCNTARIKGMGARPEDTRLIGTGHYRVLQFAAGGALENVTVTNGYARDVAGYSSSGRGGATYNGTITNCLFIGNRSDKYGGATSGGDYSVRASRFINNSSYWGGGAHAGSIYNCEFAFNTATASGGGAYNTGRLLNCVIVSNTAVSSAGVWKGTISSNNVIACNRASGNVGGCYVYEGDVCSDCIISNNVAETGYGGVGGMDTESKRGTMIRCTVVGNVSASNASGIGQCLVYDSRIEGNISDQGSWGSAVYKCMLSNCVVSANYATKDSGNITGASVYYCTVYDTSICSNICHGTPGTTASQACGCGAHSSTLYDCRVFDNYSTHMAAGVRDCKVYRSLISNNVAPGTGPNSLSSHFVDCVVEGTHVYGGSALRTVFRNIGQEVALQGIPNAGDVSRASSLVIEGPPAVTNCLFTGNRFAQGEGKIFYGGNSGGSVVNCTIVSNVVKDVFYNFKNATASPCLVENTLMFGNGFYNDSNQYFPRDYGGTSCNPSGIKFNYCAYGTSGNDAFSYYIVDTIYKFGEADGVGTPLGADTPAFCLAKDPEHPFSLRLGSRLVGRGLKQAWMETATDIRGEGYARLRDNKVDIGCYQCWLEDVGLKILFR